MSADPVQMPSGAGNYFVYNQITNTFHCIVDVDMAEDGESRISVSATPPQSAEPFTSSSAGSDSVPIPVFGMYAYNGCWYPCYPIIVPDQEPLTGSLNAPNCVMAPSVHNAPLQTPIGFNAAPQLVMPPQVFGEPRQSPQFQIIQMPPTEAPRIHNTSNYYFSPYPTGDLMAAARVCNDFSVVRSDSSGGTSFQLAGLPYFVPEKTAGGQLSAAPAGTIMQVPTVVQYTAPDKVVRVPTAASRQVPVGFGGSTQAYLKNVCTISAVIEMLYGELKGTNMPNGRPTLLTPFASNRSPGLESVWKKHFALLFGLLEGRWQLEPTDVAPKAGYTVFRDMAKVRFSCQFCMRGWTSMFGVVIFFYRWNAAEKRGVIRFVLMGQSCNMCVKEDLFETPMWYPEEAQKVMTNLFYDVSSRVYGQLVPPFNRDRRHGRPRHQHNAQQCQGCVLHLCKPQKKTTSENGASQDRNRHTVTQSSANDSASSDGLGRLMKTLRVSGQSKSGENGVPPDANVTVGEQGTEFQNGEVPLAQPNEAVHDIHPAGAAVAPEADGDSNDGVQRDPQVAAAIAGVKKTLAERSSRFMRRRNPNKFGVNTRIFLRP